MPLEKNRIYNGDCIKQLAKIEPGTVDLVFADPPFNIGYEYDVYDDRQSSDDYLEWSHQWMTGVWNALKSDGTFWLAIGDEYAAELKITAQKIGFHCRSWVIWYYTFGVNCANGFSRSHTHLFHFVKDKKHFTFNRPNPNVRVASARQLVYADLRANPNGRLPDNTWITRPQDAPDAFRPSHDTWFYSRVAGTFKEREGFHGCQMPEQLLARIIRTTSHPLDLVLDPFSGSGTTLCVAKKLNRNWMGFELSKDYVKHIRARLAATSAGDPLDGPEDPIESAPPTARGKRRSKTEFDDDTITAVIESYQKAGEGYPVDYILCDKVLNKQFVDACLKRGIGGSAIIWNRLLVKLNRSRKLPAPERQPESLSDGEVNRFGYASEVAWRLIADDFGSPTQPMVLDDILCCPETAAYFDSIASQYGPVDDEVTSLQYRQAAVAIRRRARNAVRKTTPPAHHAHVFPFTEVDPSRLESIPDQTEGIYMLAADEVPLYVGESDDLGQHLARVLANPQWERFSIDLVLIYEHEGKRTENRARTAAVIQASQPLLNARAWYAARKPAAPAVPKVINKRQPRQRQLMKQGSLWE